MMDVEVLPELSSRDTEVTLGRVEGVVASASIVIVAAVRTSWMRGAGL